MHAPDKDRAKAEFGDFQTPTGLAREVCALLVARGVAPAAIVEPTCGTGTFVVAALEAFPSVRRALAVDIDARHIESARVALGSPPFHSTTELLLQDFFQSDWRQLLESLPEPLLVIGNPPWVTNADLGSIQSSNIPHKSNFQARRGLDAVTGKSNFDISEWMLIRLLEELGARDAVLAMLCKTTVARKVLHHVWKSSANLRAADLYLVDARRHFGAAVDACLLVCRTGAAPHVLDCTWHADLAALGSRTFGWRDGSLIADVSAFDRWKHLAGPTFLGWRSGIKHDCSKVMELELRDGALWNGLGERVVLEESRVFPLLKSSALANGRTSTPARRMLVPQSRTGEDTAHLRDTAPLTWKYLMDHAARLDARASSIYASRSRFSIFGVGDYAFAPWKVAISGFYKRLAFRVVGPHEGRPVVLDDTCYFLPCRTREQAELLARLLASQPAQEFYSAFVFWDAKRPVTVELLRRLDLVALARELEAWDELGRHFAVELSLSPTVDPQPIATVP